MYRSRARSKNSDNFSMAMGDLKENYNRHWPHNFHQTNIFLQGDVLS